MPAHDALAPVPVSDTIGPSIEKLLANWRGVAVEASEKHSNACDHYENLDGWLGIGSTALTAIVGSAVFVSIQHSPGDAAQAIVGFIGVVAAIASGIQTTAKYGQRAERHRQASRQYGATVRQIDELRALPPGASDLQARLDSLRKGFDDTGAMAPNVPPNIWNAPATSKPKLVGRRGPAEPKQAKAAGKDVKAEADA
ncbi:MAG TPA: SLATT domain-containing protein [Gaiellaceae bacterium]|nr:SLATT domain-containing protein [Gaiellaceae bacterium]